MGAQTAVDTVDVRWLTPLPLWAGILTGPIVWAVNLTASYALVQWVCHSRSYGILPLITILSLAAVAAAAAISWRALMHTTRDVPTDGGRQRQRARFMAQLGLASSALFALQIVAGAVPHMVLDACQ